VVPPLSVSPVVPPSVSPLVLPSPPVVVPESVPVLPPVVELDEQAATNATLAESAAATRSVMRA
jgi:hypothetical protein